MTFYLTNFPHNNNNLKATTNEGTSSKSKNLYKLLKDKEAEENIIYQL